MLIQVGFGLRVTGYTLQVVDGRCLKYVDLFYTLFSCS